MDILQVIADELQIKKGQVEKSVELIDEGATIPFIARYRKEVTGSLNDEQLRALSERLVYLRNLEEKKASVLATIEEQGKLTDELKKQIEAVMTMVALEDLYRPYRPKRRTRATIAKEKSLEPLAEILRAQATTRTIEEGRACMPTATIGHHIPVLGHHGSVSCHPAKRRPCDGQYGVEYAGFRIECHSECHIYLRTVRHAEAGSYRCCHCHSPVPTGGTGGMFHCIFLEQKCKTASEVPVRSQ